MECNVSISCPLSPTTDVQYVVAVEFVSFVFERHHNNWITATTTSINVVVILVVAITKVIALGYCNTL